ncbi:MAG TPA: EAL domain-containing protein [Usitatibacter sp.]|nr:EAL domain-containing protein [Usitatibacter sp.]
MSPIAAVRRGLSRLVEPTLAFPLAAATLIAVIWGMTLNVSKVEREGASRGAAASALELGDTYEAQVLRALREIDQTLKFVKHSFRREGGRVDLAYLKSQGLLLPDLLFLVSIADDQGRIVASSRSSDVHNVGTEDFFLAVKARDEIAMSQAQRSAAGDWRLHFARPLEGPAGGFAGSVIVTVPASYFVSGYESSRLGMNGVLGISGLDGVFRARRTGEDVAHGERSEFRALMALNAHALPVPLLNAWDGERRFTVARQLFEFPLAVVVGLSETEQMAATNERVGAHYWRAAGGSVLLLLLFGGLGLLSAQLSRTRARASLALQEEVTIRRRAEADLKLRDRAIESSVNAILITDLSSEGPRIQYVNPAFESITGYAPGEVIGRDTAVLFGGDLQQQGVLEIQSAMRERREARAVLRNYRKDGSPFWNEYSIAPVRNEAGVVTHYVEIMNDVTEAKNYEQQLAHQANFDALTGLANRNLLQDRLQQAIGNARRDGGQLAVVFLDLDHFKVVNDGLGHNAGDELLKTIGARLAGCVRENDTVSRQGGDEFVLVLLGSRDAAASFESGVTTMITRLLEAIAEPISLRQRQLRPTCSIGISVFPQDGDDADALLRNADAAMYRAKELGRNRFQFFTTQVHERIQRRMELESSLRQALEREEFVLHYQPQVDMRSGAVIGVEALLRWQHPTRGLVPPGEFIGFAEETGLIVPIGKWVLGEACRQNKAWQDAGLPQIAVAVNMSARQCDQPDVVTVVEQALAHSGLEPRYLELEITESISMGNPSQSVPLMHRLKATGVALSIDDFGTGFSNLSYLRRYPVDRLKIDLSFVREIVTDPGSLAISEAIITMSHNLQMQVVAEGVESEAQLELLGLRGCDSIQGYYFSPPLAREDLAELLREGRRLPPQKSYRTQRPAALVM